MVTLLDLNRLISHYDVEIDNFNIKSDMLNSLPDCVRRAIRSIPTPMITGRQIRAACALLGWNLRQLAEKAEVGVATVQRMQMENGVPGQSAKKVLAVQEALQDAGVEFLDDDGVKLRRPSAQ